MRRLAIAAVGIALVLLVLVSLYASIERIESNRLVSTDRSAYALLESNRLIVHIGDGSPIKLGGGNKTSQFVLKNISGITAISNIRTGFSRNGIRVVTLEMKQDGRWLFADFPKGRGYYSTYIDSHYDATHSTL